MTETQNGEQLSARGDLPRAPRIAVVLGGGGLKGFAHIGALRAIEEAGIRPSLYAGTSIGGLIAAAHVGGLPLDSMATRAASLKRRDLFRLNHVGMLLDRLRADSMYLEEPLRALAENNTPKSTFDSLPIPLIVNTVDIERGTLVPWGTPGLRDVRVSDAVYASCALPGFFPPGEVGGRRCVDGGTMDNLPIEIAALNADLVIAIDVGNSDLLHDEKITREGFASVYMRAATIMMYALQGLAFTRRTSPPTILVRPKVAHIGWFDFGRSDELADEGYRATKAAIADWERLVEEPGGIFPRRALQVSVDQDKCTGCGLCVALAPNVMAMDGRGKAYALTRRVAWSASEGDFVRHCPTNAIKCERVELPQHPPAVLPPSVPRHTDAA